jgi:hypothetical protein
MTLAESPIAPDVDTRVAEITGFLNVQHARLVRTVADGLAAGACGGSGLRSPAHWLAIRAGVSPTQAQLIVRVAERLDSFPQLEAAFEAGRFTLDQVAEIVKAPEWADNHVLEFAQIATVSQLRVTMRDRFFDAGAPASEEAEAAETKNSEPKDRLAFGPTGDHRWRINGELDIDAGRRIEAALTEAKDSLFERGDTDATWPDALVEVAERSLDAVASDSRRDRHRTWLHLDVTNGATTTTDGWRIPLAVRDRLLCDGVVQPVWERDGIPFASGRSQRVVSDRLRRVVERRDRGCRVPGCTNERYVEVHHIIHWLQGGVTDSWNLISLCPYHHRAHHRGLLGISGNADTEGGVVVTDADGRPLPTTNQPKPPDRDPDPPSEPYVPPTGERLDHRWFSGWVHPDELARRRDRNRRRPHHPPNPPPA